MTGHRAPAPAVDGLTSVVVVTADSGDGVGECVERILRSTAPVEAIVVDNASRDGSIERLTKRVGQDPRVRILYNEKNLGFGAACNRGAAAAHGDAVMLLNPDCLIEVDTTQKIFTNPSEKRTEDYITGRFG